MREESQRFARQFAAMGHGVRIEILRLLLAVHPDGMVVGDLQNELDIPGSTLSHHLDALRQEGLVEKRREGRYLRYLAGTGALQELLGFLYQECCTRGSRVPIELPQARRRADA